jgi:hypothetical protein
MLFSALAIHSMTNYLFLLLYINAACKYCLNALNVSFLLNIMFKLDSVKSLNQCAVQITHHYQFGFRILIYLLLVSSGWSHLCTIRPNFTSILKTFCTFYLTGMFGTRTLTLDLYMYVFRYGGRAWAFPICTDCVAIFLNVVAKGGTVRWNWHITPDLCLATSWLHDLI